MAKKPPKPKPTTRKPSVSSPQLLTAFDALLPKNCHVLEMEILDPPRPIASPMSKLSDQLVAITGRPIADLYREAHDRLPGLSLDVHNDGMIRLDLLISAILWAEIPRIDLEMIDGLLVLRDDAEASRERVKVTTDAP